MFGMVAVLCQTFEVSRACEGNTPMFRRPHPTLHYCLLVAVVVLLLLLLLLLLLRNRR